MISKFHTCSHAHTHAHACIIHTCMYAHTYTHACIHTACMHTYTHVCTCMHTHMHTCTCTTVLIFKKEASNWSNYEKPYREIWMIYRTIHHENWATGFSVVLWNTASKLQSSENTIARDHQHQVLQTVSTPTSTSNTACYHGCVLTSVATSRKSYFEQDLIGRFQVL